MNTAILLSGGVGSRMQSDVPKQYIRVGGRLLISYALAALAESPFIDRILIVAEEEWREAILSDAAAGGVPAGRVMGFALPGVNRQGSVINGMQEIWNRTEGGGIADGDTVFIHDAARPLLSGKMISACFGALAGHDGVLPVLPMKDTIYLSRDGAAVSELLERRQLYAGQAPELFLFGKYYQANMALTPEALAAVNGSTEPAVMAGMDIVMIPGDENNFKVTTRQDLERFRSIVENGEKV